jgi:putative NADPH-quinone reductase
MHIYIVFAHPSHRSFSRGVLDAFANGLTGAGHSFEVADLDQLGFRGGMMPLDHSHRETNLRRAYERGRTC